MEKIRVCHRCGMEIEKGAFCVGCTLELARALRSFDYENVNLGEAKDSFRNEPMVGRMRFIGTTGRRSLCK